MYRVKRMRGTKGATTPTLSWSVSETAPDGAFVRAVAWAAREGDARSIAWALNSCEGGAKKRALKAVS